MFPGSSEITSLSVMSENEADISEILGDLAFNFELRCLREIELVVRKGLKSFGRMGNQGNSKLKFKEQVAEFERLLIRNALIRTGGNQRRAAQALGIKASTLNAKIKRYEIDLFTLAEEHEVDAG